MADFCNTCSAEMFPEGTKPDIDLEALFKDLEDGEMYNGLLCEGCGIRAIGMFNGVRKAIYTDLTGWVDYDEKFAKRMFDSSLNGEDDEESK